jgi:hypothetical protein
MYLQTLLHNKGDTFTALCQLHEVEKLYAFGSVVTDRFDIARSDVDLLVQLSVTDPIEYGEKLLTLWDGLETLFGRRVDLLTPEAINNPYLRKSIEGSKKLIYDRQGQKVLV